MEPHGPTDADKARVAGRPFLEYPALFLNWPPAFSGSSLPDPLWNPQQSWEASREGFSSAPAEHLHVLWAGQPAEASRPKQQTDLTSSFPKPKFRDELRSTWILSMQRKP